MFVFGEIFQALAHLVNTIFQIIYFLLIIRIILSWFSVNPYNDIVQILYKITEPLLMPFRRLPLTFGPMDFSPILAFLVLWFVRDIVVGILMQLAVRLK
ncbi:MAG: YggT family protein [Candidatus Omnitrophota bacterium]